MRKSRTRTRRPASSPLVLCSRDSSTGGRLYIDNLTPFIWDPTTLTTSPDNIDPVRIGADWFNFSGRRIFRGTIDEVEFFDRALSDSEVASIFLADCQQKYTPEIY